MTENEVVTIAVDITLKNHRTPGPGYLNPFMNLPLFMNPVKEILYSPDRQKLNSGMMMLF